MDKKVSPSCRLVFYMGPPSHFLHRLMWAPVQQDLWMRDTMTVLQHILGDIQFASAMKWGPEKLYNSDHQRVYSELWSGKWWWRKQVLL